MPKRFVAQPSHDPLDLSPAASCYAAAPALSVSRKTLADRSNS